MQWRSRRAIASSRSPPLDERSSRLAQALRDSGVGPGDRVAYLDRTAPEVIELLFAVSKIGAVIVPMNWRLAGRELSAVLADSAARVLIAGADFSEIAAELIAEREGSAKLIIVGARGADGYERWLSAHDALDPGHRGDADDVVVQMYTSGTTGVPEGRPDNAPQPRRRRGDLATLGVRRRVGQPDAVADVPHRRHRVGLRRPVERRHHDPRARTSRPRGCSPRSSNVG